MPGSARYKRRIGFASNPLHVFPRIQLYWINYVCCYLWATGFSLDFWASRSASWRFLRISRELGSSTRGFVLMEVVDEKCRKHSPHVFSPLSLPTTGTYQLKTYYFLKIWKFCTWTTRSYTNGEILSFFPPRHIYAETPEVSINFHPCLYSLLTVSMEFDHRSEEQASHACHDYWVFWIWRTSSVSPIYHCEQKNRITKSMTKRA
jgi:hypothetical protein